MPVSSDISQKTEYYNRYLEMHGLGNQKHIIEALKSNNLWKDSIGPELFKVDPWLIHGGEQFVLENTRRNTVKIYTLKNSCSKYYGKAPPVSVDMYTKDDKMIFWRHVTKPHLKFYQNVNKSKF